MQENDLITEVFPQLVPADKGMRFLNYIIDIIIFYVLLFCILFLVALAYGGEFEFETESGGAVALFYLAFFALFILYYGSLEAMTKGRTIGKLITRTKAVREDGSEISAGDAFKRSVSRLVPFEVFSGLGDRPWHDSWTKTIVVRL